MRAMRVLPLLAAALLACGCSTTLRAENYDASCTSDNGCVAVFEGDACAVCGCPNAAISQGEAARYAGDAARLVELCGPLPAAACGACLEPTVACVQGRCTVVR